MYVDLGIPWHLIVCTKHCSNMPKIWGNLFATLYYSLYLNVFLLSCKTIPIVRWNLLQLLCFYNKYRGEVRAYIYILDRTAFTSISISDNSTTNNRSTWSRPERLLNIFLFTFPQLSIDRSNFPFVFRDHFLNDPQRLCIFDHVEVTSQIR